MPPKAKAKGGRASATTKPAGSKPKGKGSAKLAATAPSSVDYVIIGGGFSGISAATELTDNKQESFVVLEDSNRLGGRNFSATPKGEEGKGMRVEHGSQYVSRFQERLWNLVRSDEFVKWMQEKHPEETNQGDNAAGCQNPEKDKDLPGFIVDNYELRKDKPMQAMVVDGKVEGKKQWFPFDKHKSPFGIDGLPPGLGIFNIIGIGLKCLQILSLEKKINVVDPKSSDLGEWGSAADLDKITVEEWLKADWWLPPSGKDMLRISCQAPISIEPTEISPMYMLWYCACNGGYFNEINDADQGPQQYWLRCGFGRVLEFLRDTKGFADKIKLGRRVTDVTTTDGVVTVTHQQGTDASTAQTITCKKLLVAVSPHTCQKINFPAPLQEKYAPLFHNNVMGRTYKCQIHYDEQWWNNIRNEGWQGMGGGCDWPLMWTMDATAKDTNGDLRPCIMTFTIGRQCDMLLKTIQENNPSGDPVKTQAILKNGVSGSEWPGLCPAISYMYTGTWDYGPALKCTGITSYVWSTDDPTNFIGGGPNTCFKPGELTGKVGALLDQPYEDKIYFTSAEMCRNIDAKKPCTWSPSEYRQKHPLNPLKANPDDINDVLGYSDNRSDLGYMNGALAAGKCIARMAMGEKPPKPYPAKKCPLQERLDAFLALAFRAMEDTTLPGFEEAIKLLETAVIAAWKDIKNTFKELEEIGKHPGSFMKKIADIALQLFGALGEQTAKDLGHAIGVVLAVAKKIGMEVSALEEKIEAIMKNVVPEMFELFMSKTTDAIEAIMKKVMPGMFKSDSTAIDAGKKTRAVEQASPAAKRQRRKL